MICIAGGSASGKTTASKLQKALEKEGAVIVNLDNYYLAQPKKNKLSLIGGIMSKLDRYKSLATSHF
jgi:uridine kinase